MFYVDVKWFDMFLEKFSALKPLSHAYILELSNTEAESARRVYLHLAAAMLCENSDSRPCGVCKDCKKVIKGAHTDINMVERSLDKSGNIKRDLSVEVIRTVSLDASLAPIEANSKVYILREAHLMNVQAQNALLKLLEEPPRGVHFILCVPNSSMLLPTVRSRCAFMRPSVGNATVAVSEYDKSSTALIRAIAEHDKTALLKICIELETLSGAEAIQFVTATKSKLASSFSDRSVDISAADCNHADKLLSSMLNKLWVNTSVKHLFGMLAALGVPEE